MEFFATFGGSTAACAAGLAVLDVIRDERLQQNAAIVGEYTLNRLRVMQQKHSDVVGDVRGEGLMIGIETVCDSASKDHAPGIAKWIKSRCKSAHKVLLSTEGPYGSVIKIKPPICFSRAEADRLVAAIEESLECLGDEEKELLRQRSREEVETERTRRALLGALS